MLVFKFIMAIFPFVREMLFPGKSTKEILKENKLAVALAVMLGLSGMFNYYMVKRVYEIAMERKSEREAHAAATKPPEPPAIAASVAASAIASSASAAETDKKTQDELRDRLNGIFGK
jgi:predicted negative regulator of RcsB-dependent stress response